MAKPIVKFPTKQKQRWPKKRAMNCIKWDDQEESESVLFSKGQKSAGSRRFVSLAQRALGSQ